MDRKDIEMPWRIERGYLPGIYTVYDGDNNPVAVDCTKDRAMLLAAAPDLLKACKIAVDALGADRTRQDRLEAQKIIHATILKVEGRNP